MPSSFCECEENPDQETRSHQHLVSSKANLQNCALRQILLERPNPAILILSALTRISESPDNPKAENTIGDKQHSSRRAGRLPNDDCNISSAQSRPYVASQRITNQRYAGAPPKREYNWSFVKSPKNRCGSSPSEPPHTPHSENRNR